MVNTDWLFSQCSLCGNTYQWDNINHDGEEFPNRVICNPIHKSIKAIVWIQIAHNDEERHVFGNMGMALNFAVEYMRKNGGLCDDE